MSMPKAVPNANAKVRPTVDTVLLSTLLNKEMNATDRVFNVIIRLTSSQTWMASVDKFKGTNMQINPEHLGKYEDMLQLAQKLGEKLLASMAHKTKKTEVGVA